MLKMCTVKKLDLKMCTIENSRSQNAGIIFLILKPGHLDLGLIGNPPRRTHARTSITRRRCSCLPRNSQYVPSLIYSQRTYTLTHQPTPPLPPFVQLRVRRVLRGPSRRAGVASTGPCCARTRILCMCPYHRRGSRVIEPLPEVTT